MNTFKHTHLSTRYDRPVNLLERVVKSYIRDNASVMTFTEVDSERREKVLRDFPNWGFVAGDKTGRDDCAIMWDSDTWRVLHAETRNVVEYMAGRIGAAYVVLEHRRTGKAVLFSVIHLPSSVEGHGRIEGGRRDEWFKGLRVWKNRCEDLAKRYGTKRMVLVADWNINLKARWVRALVKSLFPRWKFVWDLSRLPVGGTHGHRLIDFTIYKGGIKIVKRPRIHRSHPVSDHRGYEEVLTL